MGFDSNESSVDSLSAYKEDSDYSSKLKLQLSNQSSAILVALGSVCLIFGCFKLKKFYKANSKILANKSLLDGLKATPKYIPFSIFAGGIAITTGAVNYCYISHSTKHENMSRQLIEACVESAETVESQLVDTSEDIGYESQTRKDVSNTTEFSKMLHDIEKVRPMMEEKKHRQESIDSKSLTDSVDPQAVEDYLLKYSEDVKKEIVKKHKQMFSKYGDEVPTINEIPCNKIYYTEKDKENYNKQIREFLEQNEDANSTNINVSTINSRSIKSFDSTESNRTRSKCLSSYLSTQYLTDELNESKKLLKMPMQTLLGTQSGKNIKNDTTENIKRRISLIDFWTKKDGKTSNNYTQKTMLNMTDTNMQLADDFIQWMFPISHYSELHPDAPLVRQVDIDLYKSNSKIQKLYGKFIQKYKNHILNMSCVRKLANENKEGIARAIISISELSGTTHATKFYNDILEFINNNNLKRQSKYGKEISRNLQYWKTVLATLQLTTT